jgi:histidyl-tRNA synthetase
MKYEAIKGTQDILPEKSWLWQYVERKLREVFEIYNYKEIRFPTFEHTELFSRSIGTDTDIVSKEMYTFLDYGKRSITLRPEGTASVARAYIEHSLGEKSPLLKLFYFGSMFRQEKPQKGRLREFYQFGAEGIGSLDPSLDAELIDLGVKLYHNLGITAFKLHLNSVGCSKCRPEHREEFLKYMKSKVSFLCSDCQIRFLRNPLRMFDCKKEDCLKELENAPLMIQFLCQECKEHYASVKRYLKELKIDFVEDGKLVRGLDYYTKTAFELKSSLLGAQDTLCGGGRYDLLIEELGGKPTPAIGFAAGMERLILVLETTKKIPQNEEKLDLFIAPLGEEAKTLAIKILENLRAKKLRCEMDYLNRSLKAQLKEADRQKAKKVLVIGENELKTGKAILKDMETGEQKEIEFEKLTKELLQA